MDALIITGMTDEDGNPLKTDNMLEVKDAYEAARKGTGFWAKVLAGVDAAVGGVTGGYFTIAQGKQDARQFVRMTRVMGDPLWKNIKNCRCRFATTEHCFRMNKRCLPTLSQKQENCLTKTALLKKNVN